MRFHKKLLSIDPALETERIVQSLRQKVKSVLRRHGGVVGVSGGVDSAVVFALAVRAFGPEKVVAVMMPDRDSSPESEKLACDGPLGIESASEWHPPQCGQRV